MEQKRGADAPPPSIAAPNSQLRWFALVMIVCLFGLFLGRHYRGHLFEGMASTTPLLFNASISVLSLPFTETKSATPSPWPKPIVIVPAVWHEWDGGRPPWATDSSLPWTVFVYQRHDPAAPLFAPNFGYEGAIYLRFIVDHYDTLPNFTAFVQVRGRRVALTSGISN